MWDDKFDGRDFYAAKTVSDGKSRYLVGWQSIRKDCKMMVNMYGAEM